MASRETDASLRARLGWQRFQSCLTKNLLLRRRSESGRPCARSVWGKCFFDLVFPVLLITLAVTSPQASVPYKAEAVPDTPLYKADWGQPFNGSEPVKIMLSPDTEATRRFSALLASALACGEEEPNSFSQIWKRPADPKCHHRATCMQDRACAKLVESTQFAWADKKENAIEDVRNNAPAFSAAITFDDELSYTLHVNHTDLPPTSRLFASPGYALLADSEWKKYYFASNLQLAVERSLMAGAIQGSNATAPLDVNVHVQPFPWPFQELILDSVDIFFALAFINGPRRLLQGVTRERELGVQVYQRMLGVSLTTYMLTWFLVDTMFNIAVSVLCTIVCGYAFPGSATWILFLFFISATSCMSSWASVVSQLFRRPGHSTWTFSVGYCLLLLFGWVAATVQAHGGLLWYMVPVVAPPGACTLFGWLLFVKHSTGSGLTLENLFDPMSPSCDVSCGLIICSLVLHSVVAWLILRARQAAECLSLYSLPRKLVDGAAPLGPDGTWTTTPVDKSSPEAPPPLPPVSGGGNSAAEPFKNFLAESERSAASHAAGNSSSAAAAAAGEGDAGPAALQKVTVADFLNTEHASSLKAQAAMLEGRPPRSVIRFNQVRLESRTPGGFLSAPVDGITLDVFEGKCNVLLVDSAETRTALVQMTMGLQQPTSGSVLFPGTPDPQLERADLGYCPEYNPVWPELRLEEHIDLYGLLRGIPPMSLDVRAMFCAGEVDLLTKQECLVRSLTAPEQRRLAVSMAYLGEPRIVVMDSPTKGMGMGSCSRRMVRELVELHKLETTVLVVTESPEEAELLGDRINVINDGRVVLIGTPAEIRAEYGVGTLFTLNCGGEVVDSRGSTGELPRHDSAAEGNGSSTLEMFSSGSLTGNQRGESRSSSRGPAGPSARRGRAVAEAADADRDGHSFDVDAEGGMGGGSAARRAGRPGDGQAGQADAGAGAGPMVTGQVPTLFDLPPLGEARSYMDLPSARDCSRPGVDTTAPGMSIALDDDLAVPAEAPMSAKPTWELAPGAANPLQALPTQQAAAAGGPPQPGGPPIVVGGAAAAPVASVATAIPQPRGGAAAERAEGGGDSGEDPGSALFTVGSRGKREWTTAAARAIARGPYHTPEAAAAEAAAAVAREATLAEAAARAESAAAAAPVAHASNGADKEDITGLPTPASAVGLGPRPAGPLPPPPAPKVQLLRPGSSSAQGSASALVFLQSKTASGETAASISGGSRHASRALQTDFVSFGVHSTQLDHPDDTPHASTTPPPELTASTSATSVGTPADPGATGSWHRSSKPNTKEELGFGSWFHPQLPKFASMTSTASAQCAEPSSQLAADKQQELKAMVEDAVPKLTQWAHCGDVIMYLVPLTAIGRLPRLMRKLDDEKERYGVKSYSVQHTSLSDVLHAIISNEELPASEVSCGQVKSFQSQKAHSNGRPEQRGNNTELLAGPAVRLKGMRLCTTQFWACMWRQQLLVTRHSWLLIMQLLLPLLMFILALHGILEKGKLHPQPRLPLIREDVVGSWSGVVAGTEAARESPLWSELSEAMDPIFEPWSETELDPNPNKKDTMQAHLLEEWDNGDHLYSAVFFWSLPPNATQDPGHVAAANAAAVMPDLEALTVVEDSAARQEAQPLTDRPQTTQASEDIGQLAVYDLPAKGRQIEYTVMVNQTAQHALPLAIHETNNALLQALMPHAPQPISGALQQLPFVDGEAKVLRNAEHERVGIIVASVLALTVLTATFVYIPVKEQSTDSLTSQVVAGAHPRILWFSMLLTDFTVYLLPATALFGMLTAYHPPSLGDSMSVGTAATGLLLYGAAAVPQSVLLHPMFSDPKRAILWLVLFNSSCMLVRLVCAWYIEAENKHDVPTIMTVAPMLLTSCLSSVLWILSPSACLVDFLVGAGLDRVGESSVFAPVLFLALQAVGYLFTILSGRSRVDEPERTTPQNDAERDISVRYGSAYPSSASGRGRTSLEIKDDKEGLLKTVTAASQQANKNGVQRLPHGACAVRLNEATKTFSKGGLGSGVERALDKVSLAIRPGECFGLLGHKGAGKTTMLRVLNGDLSVPSQAASVFGRLCSIERPTCGELGYCPETSGLTACLTAPETLMYYARIRGMDLKEMRRAVARILAKFMLNGTWERRVADFTEAERRRLTVAVAFIGGPKLVLLDDPAAGMDLESKQVLWKVLRQAQSAGMTVLFTGDSTEVVGVHNDSDHESLRVCTNVGVMCQGQLKLVGSVSAMNATMPVGIALWARLPEENHAILVLRVSTMSNFDHISHTTVGPDELCVIMSGPEADIAGVYETVKAFREKLGVTLFIIEPVSLKHIAAQAMHPAQPPGHM